MLRFGSGRTFPLTFILTTLPPRSTHPHRADATRHSPRLLGRHLTLRTAYEMGRLDRARGYHPDHRLQRPNVRDAKNTCFKKSEEGADCGERGDERDQLL